MATQVLLLGSSGIPGRYILGSLIELKSEQGQPLDITILKRHNSAASTDDAEEAYSITKLDDYSNAQALLACLRSVNPDIVISALNAEPAPVLDNLVVDALLDYQEETSRQVLFINGYTLDLLHPSVDQLPEVAKQSVSVKIQFALRLKQLAVEQKLHYCTVVNASFLDYCLVKGYSAVNLSNRTATYTDNGTATITGCSLDFVGHAVALIVRIYAFGSEEEKSKIRDQRLRIAEAGYSGRTMTECVGKIIGEGLKVKHQSSKDLLEAGKTIQYLNWVGTGASDFSEDGFDFGKNVLRRKSLMEICKLAMQNGVEVFEGVGR